MGCECGNGLLAQQFCRGLNGFVGDGVRSVEFEPADFVPRFLEEIAEPGGGDERENGIEASVRLDDFQRGRLGGLGSPLGFRDEGA